MPNTDTIYELRCVDAPKLALTITSNSKTNGAAAILYESNGYQCQRFKAVQDGDTWYFVAQHDNKVLASYDTTPSAGGKVCQWTYAENQAWCQWELEAGTSVTIDSVSCDTATIKRKDTSLYLDATQPLNGESYNVLLQEASDRAQTFAFLPVKAYWSQAPVPYDLCIAANGEVGQIAQDATSVYVGFHVSKMYGISMRYRTRTLDLRGVWSAWSDWGAWTAQNVTSDSGYYWTGAIQTPVDISTAKCMEVNVQLCSATTYQGTVYYGNVADSVFRVVPSPTINAFTGAVMTPAGMKLTYTADYSPVKFIFAQIGSYSGSFEAAGEDGTVSIPLDVCGWYEDGTTIDLKYSVGNDVLSVFDGIREDTATVTYTGGSISPEVTIDDWGILRIVCEGAQGYMMVDGDVYEGMTFPVPFSKPFEVWIVKDGEEWGVERRIFNGYNVLSPCHAIVGDSVLLVKLNVDAGLSESISVSAESSSTALDGARWMHVAMSGTVSGTVTVTGALVEGKDTINAEDVRDMVGTHALWRGAYGTLFRVGVTSASTERARRVTTVSITLEVEQ